MSEKKACPCCCKKHTARSEEEKKKLINRLKRIEGQIRGIIGMMEKLITNFIQKTWFYIARSLPRLDERVFLFGQMVNKVFIKMQFFY